jgi:hypothetical protein
MYIINKKQIVWLVVLVAIAGVMLAFNPLVKADNEIQVPELPPACSSLQVQAGNQVFFHVYALGVQIYRWNGASWDFVAPAANLYADAGYNGKVGFHYAGPTWESNSGSKVLAARVPGTGCTPDSSAIAWLKLQKVSTDGPGIFNKVTYIQRANTTGGIAPSNPGSTIGEEKRVPYTAEYYFYRAQEDEE